MAWSGVITNSGKAAIEGCLASGDALNLNIVKTGTGTVPSADMRDQTDMVSQADTGSIIGKTTTSAGAQIQISVGATQSTRYVMKEIGLFATLEDESTVMIAYYNDDGDGVEIPEYSSFPDFNFILYCILDIINSDDLTVTLDMSHSVLVSNIANNLTTDSATTGKVLDARQGKVLDDAKLAKANVYNGLDKTDSGFALDARQGKALNDLVGSPSSASSVTGNDAFSKIATLNSKYGVYTLSSSQELLTVARDTSICPENSIRWINPRNGSVSGGGTQYGMACVHKRLNSAISVYVYSDFGTTYLNTWDNSNSEWTGWNTLALNSVLGSPSSASSVAGDDAFSKIATLNSKLTNLIKTKDIAISVGNTNYDGYYIGNGNAEVTGTIIGAYVYGTTDNHAAYIGIIPENQSIRVNSVIANITVYVRVVYI